jgi:monovalent cation:H+ antiporter-2, CPA2 family
MVLARLLSERRAINSSYGQIMIGISLMEDLAVVFITMMLPAFVHPGLAAIEHAGWMLLEAVAFLVPFGGLSMIAIPWILRRTLRVKDEEFLLVVAFTICLGTAALAHRAGFSTALGAFLAGLSISGSKDLHPIEARLSPLRNAFVALFFVSLGTLVQPAILWQNLSLLLQILVLIIVGKFIIWSLVVLLFGYSPWIALATAAGLSQIGELSFVIVRAGRINGLVGENVFVVTLAASLLSIFINVFIVRAVLRKLHHRLLTESHSVLAIATPAPAA